MEMLEKYLPIGSVVLLKGASKRVMIIGLCTTEKATEEKTIEDKIWDYSGCLYPEGLLSSTQICMFNHDQIEKIYHLGLIDQE